MIFKFMYLQLFDILFFFFFKEVLGVLMIVYFVLCLLNSLFFLFTHVMVIASSNCHILTAPNTGIYLIDRCERVHITAIAGLIRIR
jgi:hypothetical protein